MARRSPELQETRQRLRALRRDLDPAQRRAAERAIIRHLLVLRCIRPGRAIGAYCAVRGEVDLAPLLARARRVGARIFLPRISSLQRASMHFRPASTRGAMSANRYGIPEPGRSGAFVVSHSLDVVLVPVLGFDERGHRLGMGAGFYDRYFKRRRYLRQWRRPLLVGVAFAAQQVPAIDASPWDVPLDLVVTEAGVLRPPRQR